MRARNILQKCRSINMIGIVKIICFLFLLLCPGSFTGFGLIVYPTIWQVSWLCLPKKNKAICCIAMDIATTSLLLLVMNARFPDGRKPPSSRVSTGYQNECSLFFLPSSICWSDPISRGSWTIHTD